MTHLGNAYVQVPLSVPCKEAHYSVWKHIIVYGNMLQCREARNSACKPCTVQGTKSGAGNSKKIPVTAWQYRHTLKRPKYTP